MRKLDAVKIADNHYQVDMRGWVCPYPKYAIESLVSKLTRGSRMDMLVDCPAATDDVPKVARALECFVPHIDQIGNGEWKIAIVKQ
jgi:TusA-related sulfurtransferase